MDEDNINFAIEKIFVNLENATKQQKKKQDKKIK